MKDDIRNKLEGKRLAAFDYGLKRVGFAVCDALHISVTPKRIFDPTKPDFWREVTESLKQEEAAAVVVGIPYRDDDKESELVEIIEKFIEQLKEKTGLPVFAYDESYSSREAVSTMLEIGKKRKKRSKKGAKDKIAAAIILKNFLNELY